VATVIAFHAHPDDEVLLTGGTLAMLAAQGHRVVIVVACDGAVTALNGRLGEFRDSAGILGAARAEHLGYADSGHGELLYPDPPGRVRFARADTDEAAARLAAIIREEDAGLLLSYDEQGGYGHRDHVKVHEVGARAAKLTGIRVLEATVPRELAVTGSGVLRALRLARYTDGEARASGTPRSAITHRVNVRRYADVKRAALAAHRTPLTGRGRSARLLRLAASLPTPVFALLAGQEWFIEPGATPGKSRPVISVNDMSLNSAVSWNDERRVAYPGRTASLADLSPDERAAAILPGEATATRLRPVAAGVRGAGAAQRGTRTAAAPV
jgi:LmbE family N-acetylglucosaminyl deacetylase